MLGLGCRDLCRMPSGRVVVVTGGNRGIGLAIVRGLLAAASDVLVVLTSRSLEKGNEARRLLLAEGAAQNRVHVLQLDVSDSISIVEAAKAIAAHYAPIYALVNNAGVGLDLPWCSRPLAASVAEETLRANFTGAVEMCEAFAPLLVPGGRIVNVSSGAGSMNMDKMSRDKRSLLMRESVSVAALQACRDEFLGAFKRLHAADEPSLPQMGEEGWWMQAYGFSKALLNAYTRVLARAWPALQVCACTPGFVATDMTHGYSQVGGCRPVISSAVVRQGIVAMQLVADVLDRKWQADALKSTSEGAETPIFLVLAAADDLSSGAFYGDSQVRESGCVHVCVGLVCVVCLSVYTLHHTHNLPLSHTLTQSLTQDIRPWCTQPYDVA